MSWREREEKAEEEEAKQRHVSDQTAMRRTTSRWCCSFLEGDTGQRWGEEGWGGGEGWKKETRS